MRDHGQKKGMIASLLLHSIVLIIFVWGMPSLSYKTLPEPQPIFVEYAAIGPESQSPLMKKTAPSVRKTTKKVETPPPIVDTPTPPPVTEPPSVTPLPHPNAAPVPKPKETPPLKDPAQKLQETSDKKTTVEKKDTETKQKKPDEKKALLDNKKNKVIAEEKNPKKKQKPSTALAKVLAAVDKLEGNLEGDDLNVPEGPKNAPLEKSGKELTMTEKDALLHQLKDCWNIPSGAPNPETLNVRIKLEIGPDAVVRKAEIVNKDRMDDPFFRAAAEAARRATFHPSCTPLKLPAGKYNEWKDLTLNFDPKYMM